MPDACVVHASQRTLGLELHVRLLHDTQVRVLGEHLRPLAHSLKYLGFDLLMCVLRESVIHPRALLRLTYPVRSQSQHGICEAPRG